MSKGRANMRVVWRKTHKYECYTCGKQYDYNDKAVFYGKQEYKSEAERKAIEKTFCGMACYYEFKEL